MTKIAAILVGHRNDRGFVQEGYEGLLRAQEKFDIALEITDHTENDTALLERRVRRAAEAGADGVVVHGSRADAAIAAVAPEWPKVKFLSPGGPGAGPNVWNYALRHYEASFLAGILAASMTKSGVVGHLSGVPIAPGKKARASYVHGVHYVDSEVRVLTGFCGNQDNPSLAARWIEAEIGAGADIVFTMLNHGRSGTIEPCRRAKVWQIGNIRDWTMEEPDVFIGSAIAAHGFSILWWVQDLVSENLVSGKNRHHGLDMPEAVRLALSPHVPASVRQRIDTCAEKILSKDLSLALEYEGPEFVL